MDRFVLLPIIAIAVGCSTKPPAPAPLPKDIQLSVSAPECREGLAVTVTAEVLDSERKKLDSVLDWSVSPTSAGAFDGTTFKCLKEGPAQISASSSGLKVTKFVKITSPLVGMWIRKGDDKAGMIVRVEGTEEQNAYVVRRPSDESLRHMKSSRELLRCAQETWTAGLKKWKSIRRINGNRWALHDLAISVSYGCTDNPMACFRFSNARMGCKRGKPTYAEDYEGELDANHLTLRDTASSQAGIQHWERIESLP